MALAGIVYLLIPGRRRRVLACVHFWRHIIGFPVMMLSLGMFLYGANSAPTYPHALSREQRMHAPREKSFQEGRAKSPSQRLSAPVTCQNGTLLALWSKGSGGCPVKIRRASATAVDPMPEHETAESALPRFNSPQDDLLERLDRAQRTIRTLEQRVSMQQTAHTMAMREKNQRIRELLGRLQGKQ
jgi:hypothetical protein